MQQIHCPDGDRRYPQDDHLREIEISPVWNKWPLVLDPAQCHARNETGEQKEYDEQQTDQCNARHQTRKIDQAEVRQISQIGVIGK